MTGNLSRIFASGSQTEFLQIFADKEPAVLAGNLAEVRQLVSVDEIGKLLASGILQPPQIKLLRSGNLIPEFVWRTEGGSVDMPALFNLMNRGATIVIDNLGPLVPNILHLEHSVERALGSRTLVNAYFTQRKGGAFAAHYDNHDVMVVQVSGTKRWEIFAPAEPPAYSRRKCRGPQQGPEDIAWQHTLRAGDIMFIPRGTWHRASVDDGAMSLHLSVTIVSLTGYDYACWVTDRIALDDLFCTDIPRIAGSEAVQKHEKLLRERLQAVLHENNLFAFLAAEDGDRAPVAINGFPRSEAPAEGDIIIPAMRRRLYPALRSDSELEVRAAGQSHRLSEAMRAILQAIDETDTGLAYGEVLDRFSKRWSAQTIEQSVIRLMAKGLAAIGPGDIANLERTDSD